MPHNIRCEINGVVKTRMMTFEDMHDLHYCVECDTPTDVPCESDGHYLCTTCKEALERENVRCHDCGARLRLSRYQYTNQHDENVRCYDCNQSFIEQHRALKQYDYVPKVWRTYGDGTLFGVEIELELDESEYPSETAEVLINKFPGFFQQEKNYIKYDGSLNNGFEIVTMPHTIEAIGESELRKVLHYMMEEGARSHNTSTCGLHVHVDNSDIDIEHRRKIAYLVNMLQSFMGVFSRRERSGYAKYKTPEFSTYNDEKYEAVNFMHSNTVEFRLFKGTLKYNTIIATMQFVKAIVEFTRHATREYLSMTSSIELRKELVAMIKNDKNVELLMYLEERGINE